MRPVQLQRPTLLATLVQVQNGFCPVYFCWPSRRFRSSPAYCFYSEPCRRSFGENEKGRLKQCRPLVSSRIPLVFHYLSGRLLVRIQSSPDVNQVGQQAFFLLSEESLTGRRSVSSSMEGQADCLLTIARHGKMIKVHSGRCEAICAALAALLPITEQRGGP